MDGYNTEGIPEWITGYNDKQFAVRDVTASLASSKRRADKRMGTRR